MTSGIELSRKLRREWFAAQKLESHPGAPHSVVVWVMPQRRAIEIEWAKQELAGRLRNYNIPSDKKFMALLSCAEQFFGRVSRAKGFDLNIGTPTELEKEIGLSRAVDLEKAIIVSGHAMDICTAERELTGRGTDAIIAAALLSGLGWASPEIRDEEFQTSDNRKIAMAEAAEYTRYVLAVLGKTRGLAFDPDETRNILRLVGNYDSPSLTPPSYFSPDDHLGLILREADRLYMLTEAGLLADLLRRKKGLLHTREILPYNAKRIMEERKHYSQRPNYDKELFISQRGLVMFKDLIATFWLRIFPEKQPVRDFYRELGLT